MSVLVLAASIREATAYGESKGIRNVRHATNPSLVAGAISEIIELPSWKSYRARHPINAAVRAHVRRHQTAQRVDQDWDYAQYMQDKDDQARARYVDALAGDPIARREILVDAANRAVEVLAADIGISVEELLLRVVDVEVVSAEKAIETIKSIRAAKPQSVQDREADPNFKPSLQPPPFADPWLAGIDPAGAAQEGDAETKPEPKRRTAAGAAKRNAAGKPKPPTVAPPAEF